MVHVEVMAEGVRVGTNCYLNLICAMKEISSNAVDAMDDTTHH